MTITRMAPGQLTAQISDPRGFLLPHYRTFASIYNTVNRMYRWTFDEALRDSRVNAVAMRRDPYYRALLQERIHPVTQLPWEIAPENKSNPHQVGACSWMTTVLARTPSWTKWLNYQSQAIWYGRYGSQLVWNWKRIAGHPWNRPSAVITDHSPVNGDKIHFRTDGTPVVLVESGYDPAPLGGTKIFTDRGMGLLLDSKFWRERFVIHKHELDDADYFEGELAGGVHGTGLRSLVYWAEFLRMELMAWMMDYMQKVGTLGLLIFWYEDGNPNAREAAENAARTASTYAALALPKNALDNKETWGVQQIPAGTAGVQFLMDAITNYFEKHIERLFIGQSLSSDSEGSGLGGTGVAALHSDTKYRIIRFDALNLAETLTTDVLRPGLAFNFPGLDFEPRFKFKLPDPERSEKIENMDKAHAWGLPLSLDEVYDTLGVRKPLPGEPMLGGQPAAPAMPGAGGSGGAAGAPAGGGSLGGVSPQPARPPAPPPPPCGRPGTPVAAAAYSFESEHPRDDAGKFTFKDAGEAHAAAVRALWDVAGRDTTIPKEEFDETLAALDKLPKRDLLTVANALEFVGMASKSATAIREAIKQRVTDSRGHGQRMDMLFPDAEDLESNRGPDRAKAAAGVAKWREIAAIAKGYSFDEGDHPRGQPDNPGQFVAKGAGEAATGDQVPARKPTDVPAEASKGRAKEAAKRVVRAAVGATVEIAMRLPEWAPIILDTAEDFAKLSYHKASDAVLQSTGLPANTMAVVATWALAKARTYLKARTGYQRVPEPPMDELVEAVMDVLEAIADGFGAGELPNRRSVRSKLEKATAAASPVQAMRIINAAGEFVAA